MQHSCTCTLPAACWALPGQVNGCSSLSAHRAHPEERCEGNALQVSQQKTCIREGGSTSATEQPLSLWLGCGFETAQGKKTESGSPTLLGQGGHYPFLPVSVSGDGRNLCCFCDEPFMGGCSQQELPEQRNGSGMNTVGSLLSVPAKRVRSSCTCLAQSPGLGGVDKGAKRDGTRGV